MELGIRKTKVLSLIVEQYTKTGEPVGSKKICVEIDENVSSATIRNDMAWLVEKGYLEQPHTSAGRIPSQKGYRHYVDNIMHKYELTDREKTYIDSMLADAFQNPDRFLESTCTILADLTGLTAVSTTPFDRNAKILRIEIIPTGIRTVLLFMMTTTGLFKSRLCRIDVNTSPEIIAILRKMLNDYFYDKELNSITPSFIKTLAVSLGQMTLVIMPLLVAVGETARGAASAQLLIDGQSNLLSLPEFDAVSVREILDFLSRRAKLFELLNRDQAYTSAYIGKENGRPELDFTSIVITSYDLGGNGSGKLAVIGSTRMDYAKVLSHLEYTADKVGKLLSKPFGEEMM